MASSIPTGSVITQAMVNDWMTRYGRTNALAIDDLDDIENARRRLPDGLPSTYDDLKNKYYANLDRLPATQKSTPVSVVALASLVLSMFIGGTVYFGNTNSTPISGFQHATSTVNPDAIFGNAATSVNLSVQGDTNASVEISTIPASWQAVTSTVQLSAYMSASGTATILIRNNSASGTTLDLPSDIVGVDVWKH